MKHAHWKKRIALVLALIGGLGAAQEPEFESENQAPNIDGAWRWDFVMPNGTTVRPRLTLTTEDGKLTGTTSFRPGSEVAITNAALHGDRLRFQVFRQREGQLIVTTYTAIWDGKTIRGKIQSNWAGEEQAFDWEAIRTHVGVEGVWTWTNSLASQRRAAESAARGGRGALQIPTRVVLNQDGEKVTGRAVPRFGRSFPIAHGSITNNEVYFEIERTFRTNDVLLKYRGKQSGDSISGNVEMETGGRTRKGAWEARRLE